MMMTAVVALALAQTPVVSPDAASLIFSQPRTVLALDLGKLKGEPFRLAWSPDASELYLQTVERDPRGIVTRPRHYLIRADGQPPKSVEQEPAWASTYWTWKSAQAPPDMPAHRISVEQRQDAVQAAGTPMGGALARGGSDPSTQSGGQGVTAGEAAAAAYQTQTVTVVTLRLKGEVLGEWTNQAVVPGSSFGWRKSGGLIAFAVRNGGLVVMDPRGRKQAIAGAGNATLPAWTDDGTRLAYLERAGKKQAALKVVGVEVR